MHTDAAGSTDTPDIQLGADYVARIPTGRETGGSGFVFEDDATAALMLRVLGGRPLDTHAGPLSVDRLDLQAAAQGWALDDVLVTGSCKGVATRLALSLKSAKQFTRKGAPADFVRALWQQYLHIESDIFDPEKDLLGIVAGSVAVQVHADVDRLLQLAHAKDPVAGLTTVGAAETKGVRALLGSFTCPADLAGREPGNVGEEATARLLSRVCVFHWDFPSGTSRDLEAAIVGCRACLLSGDVGEAEELWEKLRTLAQAARPANGSYDLSRLLDELTPRFRLRGHPDYDGDWRVLRAVSERAAARVSTSIGDTVTLPREAEVQQLVSDIEEAAVLGIVAPPGSGKSSLAKLWAETRAAEARVLWFNALDLEGVTQATTGSPFGLSHQLADVFAATECDRNVVVIDGLDTCSDTALEGASYLISTLDPSREPRRWRVVIPCRLDAWNRVAARLPLGKVSVAQYVLDPEIALVDIAAVVSAYPRLGVLLGRPHLRGLRRSLKILDILASQSGLGGPDALEAIASEPELIAWYWDTEVARGGVARAGCLQRIACQMADAVRASVSHGDVEQPQVVDALIKDGILRVQDQSVVFAHDLIADWARYQHLVGSSDTVAFLRDRIAKPAWHHAVRLWAQERLDHEAGGERWQEAFADFADFAGFAQAQSLLLDAVALSPDSARALSVVWPVLIGTKGLLDQFLARLRTACTVPNPLMEHVADDQDFDLQVFLLARDRIPLPTYWEPVLEFLCGRREEATSNAPIETARTVGTWLRLGLPDWAFRSECAELALDLAEMAESSPRFRDPDKEFGNAAYRAALAAFAYEPVRVREFVLRGCGRLPPLPRDQTGDRTGPLPRATREVPPDVFVELGYPRSTGETPPPWPDGPAYRCDAAFAEACLNTDAMHELVKDDPALAAEALLALLIELPSVSDTDGLAGQLQVRAPVRWFPPFWHRGPFGVFLRLHPETAIALIATRVNFATERWLAWDGLPTDECFVTVTVDGAPTRWHGDPSVYRWLADAAANHAIASALMALEKWLYDEIEADRPVDEAIGVLCRHASSVAFAGLLSTVARRSPALFRGSCGFLLTVPEFHQWDRSFPNTQSRGPVMLSWRLAIGETEQTRQLAEEWYGMPHRDAGLHEYAVTQFLSDSESSSALISAADEWVEMASGMPVDDRWRQDLLRLAAPFDRTNWRREQGADGQPRLRYEVPEELLGEDAADADRIMQTFALTTFPWLCRRLIDGDEVLALAELDAFWGQLQEFANSNPEDMPPVEVCRIEDIICGGVAVLVIHHRAWLRDNPTRETWCRQQLVQVVDRPPTNDGPLGRHPPIDGTNWEAFCAQATVVLWAESPGSPELRRGIALLAMNEHHDVVSCLFQAAFQHRRQLGNHWDQLEVLALRRAVTDAAGRSAKRAARSRRSPLEPPDEQGEQRLHTAWEAWTETEIGCFVQGVRVPVLDLHELMSVTQAAYLRAVGVQQSDVHAPQMSRSLLRAMHAWFTSLDQASDRDEREAWIQRLHGIVSHLLARVPLIEERGGPPRPPTRTEDWGMGVAAQLVSELRHDDPIRPDEIWAPILELGYRAHHWVGDFLRSWVLTYLRQPNTLAGFLARWREMIEHAMASGVWDANSGPRAHDRLDLWLRLMGYKGILMEHWSGEHASCVAAMRDLHERVATQYGPREDYAWYLADFLSQPAAAKVRPDGLTWLAAAVGRTEAGLWHGHHSERIKQTVTSLLAQCLRERQSLERHGEAWRAFLVLLDVLAGLQYEPAAELQRRVGG